MDKREIIAKVIEKLSRGESTDDRLMEYMKINPNPKDWKDFVDRYLKESGSQIDSLDKLSDTQKRKLVFNYPHTIMFFYKPSKQLAILAVKREGRLIEHLIKKAISDPEVKKIVEDSDVQEEALGGGNARWAVPEILINWSHQIKISDKVFPTVIRHISGDVVKLLKKLIKNGYKFSEEDKKKAIDTDPKAIEVFEDVSEDLKKVHKKKLKDGEDYW